MNGTFLKFFIFLVIPWGYAVSDVCVSLEWSLALVVVRGTRCDGVVPSLMRLNRVRSSLVVCALPHSILTR